MKHKIMRKFKVILFVPGYGKEVIEIEARECIISENAYTFYGGEIGVNNYNN